MILEILGRRDHPTDGVEDYCRTLGEAFGEQGIESVMVSVPWDEIGRAGALRELWRQSEDWKGKWALVQYTALMWSSHGFPLLFLVVLALLRIRGTRTAVVFHDANPWGHGDRLIDMARRVCQRLIMRWGYRCSQVSITTIPLEHVFWLPSKHTKTFFIPVGTNLPVIPVVPLHARNGECKKIVVSFSLSSASSQQVLDLALALRKTAAAMGDLHLLMLGRTMEDAEAKIREVLKGSSVHISNLGLLPAQDVSRHLALANVLVFTRGEFNTNRGSCMAGVACGLPVVAYGKSEPFSPLSEAGVLFVPYGDHEGLSKALVAVLADDNLWLDLHQRNLRAHEHYFSRNAIAVRYLSVLQPPRSHSVPIS